MTSSVGNFEKPPPPSNLSKENVGVWMGWCCKGDKEVAREAAAKGIAVDLVVLFMSQRKKVGLEEAENYYRDEVFLWVKELLDRKQIFRVSHILTNIGVNPHEELSKVFCTTTNRELREYIGNHLKNQNKLDEHLQQLWHFLDVILKNGLLICKWKMDKNSIECLNNQESSWKSKLAAVLFLKTNNIQLLPFLSAEALWKQLLIYNDIKLVKVWTHIYYNEIYDMVEMPDNLLRIFKQFAITDEMINQLNSPDTSANTSNIILNDLCQFGVFCDGDKTNFLNIISRLYNSNNIQNIFQILRKNTCNLVEKHFLNQLVNYCVENKWNRVMSVCIENFDIYEDTVEDNHHLELILQFRQLIQHFEEDFLKDNILKVAQFLSQDLEVYCRENPLILLSLIFFSKDVSMESVIEDKVVNVNGITLKESVEKLPKQLKFLNAMMNRKEVTDQTISYYQLLEKHYKVDVKKLFKKDTLPDFSNSYLLEKFGYLKKINYLFYVKQYRPSFACKMFLLKQYEDFKGFPEGNVKILQRKIFKIVIQDFTNMEIVSSCVGFLEMIGFNSNFIKVAVTSAKTLIKNGIQVEEVKEMFLNIENSPLDILTLLETTVIKNIDFLRFNDGFYFIEAIKTYDIVIDFTICYDLKLPVTFLKNCGSNNMWMQFLIFSQLKNYPIEQIKPLLQSFKNPNLLEHLHHSVVHDIDVDEHNVLMRERNSSRNEFLWKIGVRKSLENLSQSDSMYSITSQSSFGSNSSSGGSDFLEIDVSNTKATLLQTLIHCHNSTDPPRALLQACQLYKNPILAIFATSYEPDSLITNWLTWLAVSTDLYKTFTNFESVALNSQEVSSLLNNCMKNKFPATLLQSFEIFIPTNPLRYFIEFLNLCIDKVQDTTILTTKLESFKTTISHCRRYSVINDNDLEMTYLTNKIWLANTALELLSSMIQFNVTSLHEQIQLLEMLNILNINEYIDCPDSKDFLEILRIVYDSNSDVRFNIVSFLNDKDERKAVNDCIDAFLDNFRFDCALEVAEIKKIPFDNILIKRWEYKFKNKDAGDIEFWSKCNEDFEFRNLSADCVVEFFLEHVSRVETSIEKYELLKLSHQWSKTHDLPSKHDLEKEKWLAYVTLEEKWRILDSTVSEEFLSNVSFKEMLEILENISVYKNTVSQEILNILNTVVNNALDNGNFWLALKLEKIFCCNNANLDVLKLCYSLAEGLIQPYQLSTEQRLIVSKGIHFGRLSNRRTFLSTRISGISSSSPSPVNSSYLNPIDVIDAPVQDTLAVLCALSEKVTSGVDIAHTIFMTYRISINIEIPYNLIVSNGDSMKMLKDALEDNCVNKLEVVHDFFYVYKWTKDQIADFICEEIVTSATKYVKSWSDDYVIWDLRMDRDYHLILQLLQDNCSVLGYKIYAFASATHKSQVLADLDFRINKLSLVIELLITAHDCFTADCNMEGISLILKKCQAVISHLLLLRSWKLIVRLLTGVGRYTEMNYVFQILRENDQFEFLLRKGSRKDNGLKTALLEYLKKYCPDNKDLYKIVALHFTLFTEVAGLWEREAQHNINNLIEIAKLEMQNSKLNPDNEPFVVLSNTDGTKMCLNKAIENYTHATEFHLQGEKLAKAMNSAKQAELIALQISLLKGLQNNAIALCVLNLTSTQITHLITHHLSFDQSLILAQAYNYQPDWSSVLFTQYVIQNDGDYLQSFLKHRPLTDSLVHDISRKFLKAKINTSQEINNMKTILNKLPSVHTKYRIASELSFADVVEDLIESEQLAYLKDTVWKKGYKN